MVLTPYIPVTMRFSKMIESSHRRKDPKTGLESSVRELACQVIELQGKPIMEIFDTLSEKLMSALLPYKDDPTLAQRLFTITLTGSGYLTEYSVQVS